jgi:predicted MFS family arabinose efflux permease
VFDIAVWRSSLAFAFAVGLRLFLYVSAGHWSEAYGPERVLRAALGVRLLAFLTLLGLGAVSVSNQSNLALVGLPLIVLPWSLLSVSSTALTAHLSPVGEGMGMGMLNATSAIAGLIGAILGGWLAANWGYHTVLGVAATGLALGLALACVIRPGRVH